MPVAINHLGQPVGDEVPGWAPPSQPGSVTLQGRFCRVEPLEPERHAAQLFAADALDADGRSWTYLPYGPFATLTEYRAWLESVAAGTDPCFYAIIDLTTECAVGVCSYLRIDPAAGSIEVGHLHFSPLLQGKPAATEAMFLMMQHAFTLGYRRYEWKCNALNEPSRRAAQRLGFSYEGCFRQARIDRGRNRDTTWYSVIDGEWPALKAVFEQWLAPANFDEHGRQHLALSLLTKPLLAAVG
ncbi:GNAT family protein [Niveibacterium umoris]|uniref:RimJ/RimL family protein N-acetyltransferase n=1 Tax=Niveibacterium umoris TaxID=1193620 RepID=A0A840BHF5_9RHOO|nr:GNAT family protein [Niveibacterium umoris]MBB4012981.1 RimJ/RimL family protein N-acetyltransferase [Niveibacterium umoris]